MAEKYPADERTANETSSEKERSVTTETAPKELWGEEESEIRHQNEHSTFVKKVCHGDEGEGTREGIEVTNEFGRAASNLPETVQKVTFVQNTVVHGNMTKENIMHKNEAREGLIQLTTVMEPQKAPKNMFDKPLEDRAGKYEKLKDLSENRTIALKHLKARLKGGRVRDLQTLRLLYESEDAVIIQNNVKEIRLKLEEKFDCFCLGKVLEKSKELSLLWLPYTSDDLIGIVIQSCEKIPKIDLLWIDGYIDSPTTIGQYYGKLSNHANKLVLSGCKFTKQGFDSFVDEIKEKFAEVELKFTRVEFEHLYGLNRLMSHIDGTLCLMDVSGFGETYISSEVKEKIPRQYQGRTVEYESERGRTVQPVPQIEAEQPIATEGDIPRLNQRENESENENDPLQGL